MPLILSFLSLFVAVILLQLSSGGLGPLDVLSGSVLGFSRTEIGLLGSAHFLGFIIGCWIAPILIGSFGHNRAFAAFIAAGIIGLISHMLVIDPLFWAGFRVLGGICIAGAYTVVESWFQAKANNQTRGRVIGIYRTVDLIGSLSAQLLISVLEPGAYAAYNILALICCTAIFPLMLTRMSQPQITTTRLRLHPSLPFMRSPLGAMAVIVAGLTGASFRMVGPLYGQDIGLTSEQIALFLAAFVAGGAAAQYPAGWLADKVDRRVILVLLSALAILSCTFAVIFTTQANFQIYLIAAFFGFTTFPIYSVASAHANDFCTDKERVEIAAALVFLFGIGAIISPIATAILIDYFGPNALFVFIAVNHVLLIGFSLIRMLKRPADMRVAYVYVPRTSFTIGHLLKLKKQKKTPTSKF